MIVLGLNAFHPDSAAAIVVDGELKAAAEEERFRRVKHWAGFPSEAVRFCLSSVGCKLRDISAIAINSDPKAAQWQRFWFGVRSRPSLALILEKLRTRSNRLSAATFLEEAFPNDKARVRVQPVEHHLAHLASAFYPSPFEQAIAVSVDGFGDFASAAWGVGVNDRIEIARRVYFPHSLGIFYQALTQYLGFWSYGDEYKVMGLAPYGEPSFLDHLKRLAWHKPESGYHLGLRYFRHHRERVAFEFDGGVPRFDSLFSAELEREFGPSRKPDAPLEQHHKDLARSAQALYEEVLFAMLREIHQRYRIDQLVMAGGCAANSVANGKLTGHTPFRDVYIAAASGDAGGAVGAALLAARAAGAERCRPITHGFWGTSYDNDACGTVLEGERETLAEQDCKVSLVADEEGLISRTVDHLIQGHVVGWFHGRMEWGPRALGARSILADPRRADMKDILNQKIKRRESFRPFAPSVLREHVSAWFEVEADVPFMSHVFPIREEKRAQIPAVTHVDGSGRLQTVRQEENPRYYRLIEVFERRTGVPILLNTSFNENEPVVCKPEEALNCFLRTKMDVLVLENWLIER
ncbi:Carbamoyltransferase [Candidatus Defluviicoccus seviourii]|uniref:Carbamoyltransferase n=1 Tax=Candidatus Defluviicoccus seviourii TaxID=2565273 RepID=A0A564WDY1_9PROT|nr:Carbamoyltransferase [Candidatus Defluviicoccus seviourii]